MMKARALFQKDAHNTQNFGHNFRRFVDAEGFMDPRLRKFALEIPDFIPKHG